MSESALSPNPPLTHRQATIAFIAISITSFLVPFVGSSFMLALPHIAEELHMNAVTLSFVITAFLLPCAMFQMPAARIADKIGRKKVYIAGIVVFSFFSLLGGLAWSGWSLLLFRALQAIGASMMFGTAMAILVVLFPPEKRGRVLGINTAIVYTALSSGPFFGGMLAHYFGWRSIFFVCTFVGLIAVFTSAWAIRQEWKETAGEPFDHLGAFLYGMAVFGVIYGFSLLPNIESWCLLLVGLLFAIAFVLWEPHAKSALLNLDLVRHNSIFRMSTIAAMLNYSVTAGSNFMLSLYLQMVRDLDAQQAGLFLMLQPIAQTIFSVLAGRWSDKGDPARVATIGFIFVGIAMFGLCFLTQQTPWWLLGVVLICFGVGFGTFSPANVSLIMGSVSRTYYGTASAVTGTARLIGNSFSIGIATLAIHLYLGNQSITPQNRIDFMSSIHLVCMISVALCLVGIYASATRVIRKQETGDRKQ